MHFKSRILATAAVLAMAAAAICGSTRELAGVETASSPLSWFDKKETIYFWYTDDTLTSYINSAAVSFGEREGVRVIPVLNADSAYLEAINEGTLRSEQVPDVYLVSNDSLERAYLAGLADEIRDEWQLCTEENFPKAALDAVSYDGRLVAYPMYYETSALVYNRTYLEQWAKQQAEKEQASAGEEIDRNTGEPVGGAVLDEAAVAAKMQEYLAKAVPTTMDDILNIADTFDVPEGVEGIMKWDVSDIFYNYWIVGNYMIVGGDVGDSKEAIDISNPETIACLEVYKALNQFFSIESETVDYKNVVQDFLDGKIVFTIGTTDVVATIREAEESGSLDFAYGIAPMPAISEELASRSMSVTNAVAVNSYSEHIALANEFAAYLTGEYAKELYDRTGKMSANRSANVDDELVQVFLEEYAGSVPLPKMMETGNFWLLLEVLFAEVWDGADVTEQVQELAENMSQQMGLSVVE